MRILYLIWALDLGGAEQIVLHLARGLDRTQFTPLIACLTRKGRFAGVAEQAGIPVRCLDKHPRMDLGLIPRLVRLVRDQRIDLIHAHLFTANLWGRLAGWRARVPVVVTEHSVDTWKPWGYRALDRLLKPLTTQWIFVSPEVRAFYEQGLGPLTNASVIRNGVAIPSAPVSHAAKEFLTLATVGRLAPEKEQRRFIELIAALRRDGLPVRGLIIGDGPQRPVLERLIAAQGLHNLLTITGLVTDMAAFWPRIDLFVLTSSREGLPLTLLEAMAHGIPVLSTQVGGVGECVQDTVEGDLVEFGDWDGLLVRARRLIEDPVLRHQRGAAGRARVEREFNVTRMVRAHEAVYRDVS